jgi:hypothetical protein
MVKDQTWPHRPGDRSRLEPAKAWLSRCGEAYWLILRLRDHHPNTFAIGSRVEVEAGGKVLRRWLSLWDPDSISDEDGQSDIDANTRDKPEEF